MSFGERLQALRRSNDLTQEEFAQQMKVSRQAVSKWESSRGYPEIEKIIFICNRYRVTMDELFQDEIPHASTGQAPDPSAAERPLESRSLKKALSDFFTNLSPHNQLRLVAGLAFSLTVLFVLYCMYVLKGGLNQMVLEIIWTALLILFAVGEGITVGLTSIWFAAGSLAALIAALLGAPLGLQLALFVVVSALCIIAARPLARRYLEPKLQPTNADRILGTEAKVTEDIDNLQGCGCVTIGGIPWSARSEDGSPLPAGTLVRILRIEGVKVYVEEVKEEIKC